MYLYYIMKIILLLTVFLSISESFRIKRKINTYLDFGLKYMQNGSCTQYPALFNLTLVLNNGIVYGTLKFPPIYIVINNSTLFASNYNGSCTKCLNNYVKYSTIVQCVYNNINKIPDYFFPRELTNNTLTIINTCIYGGGQYKSFQTLINNYLKIINNNFVISASYATVSPNTMLVGCSEIYDYNIKSYLQFFYMI